LFADVVFQVGLAGTGASTASSTMSSTSTTAHTSSSNTSTSTTTQKSGKTQKKRGRPPGSTKQADRERMAKNRSSAVTAGIIASENSDDESGKSDSEHKDGSDDGKKTRTKKVCFSQVLSDV
jgi:hypothetical protein